MVLKLSYTVRTPGKIFSILINPACIPDQSHQNLWGWQLSVDIFTGSLEFRSFVQKQCFSNFNVIWTTWVSFQTFGFQFPRSGMGIMHVFFFFFLTFQICLYLFLAVLDLHCCAWAFSSCCKWGLLFIAGFSLRWLLLLQSTGFRLVRFRICDL